MPQVEIPQQLYDRLQRLLPGEQTYQEVAVAALTEWADWIDGSFRPMTMSDLETRRIAAIYEHILIEQLPSAEHLGRLLRLPMGRSRYIIQSLSYRYGRLMHSRQIQVIVAALDHGRWSADHSTCVVHIETSCRPIVDRFLQSLFIDGQLNSIVRGKSTMNGVRYELGSGHHEVLNAALRAYLQQDEPGG